MWPFSRKKSPYQVPEPSDFELGSFLPDSHPWSQPDWQAIWEALLDQGLGEDNATWSRVAIAWAQRVVDGKFLLKRSDNFLVAAPVDERSIDKLLSFLEGILRRILRDLPDLASDQGVGLHVAFGFADLDGYEDYLSHATGRHSTAASSGCYLNQGYGHFVFPWRDDGISQAVVAHELTHALVAHLHELPLWVNEGIAVNIEHAICSSVPIDPYDPNNIADREHWTPEDIQLFWSGQAFHDGRLQGKAYFLARMLVNAINSFGYDVFRDFVCESSWEDAGNASARNHLGFELDHFMDELFGVGDWVPNPDCWEGATQEVVEGVE